MSKVKKSLIWIVVAVALVGIGYWWYQKPAPTQPGRAVSDMGREHVDDIYGISYNSNPPTSGPHFPIWAKRGVYDRILSDGYLIHSLEHGYVIISYNCDKLSAINLLPTIIYAHDEPVKESSDSGQLLMHMKLTPSDKMTAFTPENSPDVEVKLPESFSSPDCKSLVNDLSGFLKDFQRLIIVPRPSLDTTLALTAWGRIDKLQEFDKTRITEFIKAFHNKGPEQTVE